MKEHLLASPGEAVPLAIGPTEAVLLRMGGTALHVAGEAAAAQLVGNQFSTPFILVDTVQYQANDGRNGFKGIRYPGAGIVIGRGPLAQQSLGGRFQHLLGDPRLSRTHASVQTIQPGLVRVQNLSTTKPTLVEQVELSGKPVFGLAEDIEQLADFIGSHAYMIQPWKNHPQGQREIASVLYHGWYKPGCLPMDAPPSQAVYEELLRNELPLGGELQKGWKWIFSRNGEDAHQPTGRLYCNVRTDALPAVAAEIMRNFEENRMGVAAKIPISAADAHKRTDTMVIRFNSPDSKAVLRSISAVYGNASKQFRDETPRLTARLRSDTGEILRGVSFAQDPSGGQSFGQSRCMLLAGAIMHGAGTSDGLLAALKTPSLARAYNVDPTNPAFNYQNSAAFHGMRSYLV